MLREHSLTFSSSPLCLLLLLVLTLNSDSRLNAAAEEPEFDPPVCSAYNFRSSATQMSVAWQSAKYGGIGCVQRPLQYHDGGKRWITVYQYMICYMFSAQEPECRSCIRGGFETIAKSCGPLVAGAQFQNQGCYLRYETYPFCT
ncbi:unnamed protein product [Linum trigynum]|uniref:Gnk2-homologous domain-containing protein n=1 Tax=Linum trigynum TaxID=586398 RepID=A0AAV2F310_9ROSI